MAKPQTKRLLDPFKTSHESDNIEIPHAGHRDQQSIKVVRFIIGAVLCVAAGLASFFIYSSLSNAENVLFRTEFHSYKSEIDTLMQSQLDSHVIAAKNAMIFFRAQNFLCPPVFDSFGKTVLEFTKGRSVSYNIFLRNLSEVSAMDTTYRNEMDSYITDGSYAKNGVNVQSLKQQVANGSFYKLNGVNTPYSWGLLTIPRSFYIPTTCLSPLSSNQAGILFDGASDSTRFAIIGRVVNRSIEYGMTDILVLVQDQAIGIVRPSTILYVVLNDTCISDCYPHGIGATAFSWDSVLERSLTFSDDCYIVLTSSLGKVYSFQKTEGNIQVINLGQSDKVSGLLSSVLKSFVLESSLTTKSNMNYTIKIYPSQALYDKFHSNKPRDAIIGIVCAILAIALLFYVYDHLTSGRSQLLNSLVIKLKERTSKKIITKMNIYFTALAEEFFGEPDDKDNGWKIPKEIERDQIILLDVLGKGAFGVVYKGLMRPVDSPSFLVAIKSFKDPSSELTKETMKEALLLNQFQNQDHVMSCVGITSAAENEPLMLILQYCEVNITKLLLHNMQYLFFYSTLFSLTPSENHYDTT
jgi:Protein tyrosine and serine/threonine kinase